jgi:alpha-N-arabinofuranosidase
MLLIGTVAGQDVSLTLRPGQVLNEVDVKIYGHFLEHIYHSCNGGLWGELIWNRSFEGTGAGQAWTISDNCLAQLGGGTNVRFLLGEPAWSDYEFTVEARKTGGEEGFLMIVRAASDKEFYWANIGGWQNAGHALERGTKDADRWGPVTRRRQGQVEPGRWYRLRALCRGQQIQVWLDDELIIDYLDDGQGSTRGKVGVGTWSTQAEYRNFKVTSLDGNVLYEGLPALAENEPELAPRWRPFGAARFSDSTVHAFNGDASKRISASGQECGIVQKPLRIQQGEIYQGSLWIRGDLKGELAVRLMDQGNSIDQRVVSSIPSDWQEVPLKFTSTVSSDQAALQIAINGEGELWIDQVSLMPESWRETGGERPDLLQAIADLRPPVIRWPGGCFASPYRWKDAIGPQHQRRPHPRTMWDDKDVNSFGTDEFIAMCRQVGAEPIIVINIGTENWNPDAQDNDFLQEALDWMEYCNGASDSKWGSVRAANGHPEPYAVKFWEIDNETWHMGADDYAAAVNRFGPAMRKADPSIKVIACGSGGYSQSWNRTVISKAGKNFDYISTHHYESPNNFATGPSRDEAFYLELKQIIDSGPNPGIRVYCSEWNAQSTDWRTGLYCGGILNVFERCGEFFKLGGPALFLRHVSATAWDNAFINFDHRTWFPAPNYVVMKLWRDHYAPHRIAVTGESGKLNVVATRTDSGKTVFLKAVNPSQESIAVEIRVDGQAITSSTLRQVAPGSLAARNTLAERDVVRVEEGNTELVDQAVRFTLPPMSCGVATIECE